MATATGAANGGTSRPTERPARTGAVGSVRQGESVSRPAGHRAAGAQPPFVRDRRNGPVALSAVHGSTIFTPTFRKSFTLRVTIPILRESAAPASMASGRLPSSGRPSRRLVSIIRAQERASSMVHGSARPWKRSSKRRWNRRAKSSRRRPGSRRPMPLNASHAVTDDSPIPNGARRSIQ